MLQSDALSLDGGVSQSSRFYSAVSLELGVESPMLLLLSNLASMGHLNVVGDKLGEECMEVDLCLEIGDVFVEGDAGVECIVG